MHQSKDMVGKACRIGVVLFNPQFGFMMKQTVEDVGGVACPDFDDLELNGAY